MATSAVYTPVGLYRYNFNERHVVAAAALTPGDFYAQADGLIGAFAGVESAALGDSVVFCMTGVYEVLCAATTDTYVVGAAVYFDTVNKYATTSGSATCLIMGTAVIAKTSGSARVLVALNSGIAPSLANAASCTTLVASGTCTLSGIVNVGGALSSVGTIAATNATTPIIQTATGKTNTGYLQVLGKTSAGLKVTCADAMGYTLTVAAAAVASADRTITLPDPGGADSVVYLALAQTLVSKTLTAPVLNLAKRAVNATPVAATGAAGGVAGAAAIGAQDIVTISSDGATKGVKLLTGVAGQTITIINTSGTACYLFAASGGTLNGLSADAGVVIAASKGVVCFCTAADTWTVYDTAAKATAV
jgi:predicted RecA/RadA family phage recombinase